MFFLFIYSVLYRTNEKISMVSVKNPHVRKESQTAVQPNMSKLSCNIYTWSITLQSKNAVKVNNVVPGV